MCDLTSNFCCYLKMLVEAVGIPILELDGALGLPGGLRLLHPWNTDSRASRQDAAKAVSESRQHDFVAQRTNDRFFFLFFRYFHPRNFTSRRFAAAVGNVRLFLLRDAGTIAKMTTIAKDLHRLHGIIRKPSIIFPLNNKSRATARSATRRSCVSPPKERKRRKNKKSRFEGCVRCEVIRDPRSNTSDFSLFSRIYVLFARLIANIDFKTQGETMRYLALTPTVAPLHGLARLAEIVSSEVARLLFFFFINSWHVTAVLRTD